MSWRRPLCSPASASSVAVRGRRRTFWISLGAVVVAPVDSAAGSTCRAHRSRMKPVGADFGRLGLAAPFMSRSMSTARSSEAAAGTPWKVKVAKKAGVQRRTPA